MSSGSCRTTRRVGPTVRSLVSILLFGASIACGADGPGSIGATPADTTILCGSQSHPIVLRKSGTREAPRVVSVCKEGFKVKSRTSPALTVLGNYITVQGGTYASADHPAIVVSGSNVTISNVVARDSKHGIHINGDDLSDISIFDSEITSNKLVGIYLNEYRPRHSYKRLRIERNRIHENGNHGIRLWFDDRTIQKSGVSDVVIRENEVVDNGADGIVVVQHSVDYQAPTPVMFDVVIEENTVRRNAGGIALRGVGSSTGYYGKSYIRNNVCSDNLSVTGGINIFWTSYLDIVGNDCSGNRSDTIDGNGILIDHGNRQIRIEKNRASNNSGNTAHLNSGVGIMVLDSSEIFVKNNVVEGNKIGIYFGGQAGARDVVVSGNEIADSKRVGLFVHKAAPNKGFEFSANAIRGKAAPFEINNAEALLRNTGNAVSLE